MPLHIPNVVDDPVVAIKRVADTLEVPIPNRADRALALIGIEMMVKAVRLEARREALEEALGAHAMPSGVH